jgi:hypothetical protein
VSGFCAGIARHCAAESAAVFEPAFINAIDPRVDGSLTV